MDEYRELNAMERQQDTNLWASSAIYLAFNGVLLIALANAVRSGSLLSILATVGIGAVGFLVVWVWDLTAKRAHQYEDWWIERAKDIQVRLKMPPSIAVWDAHGPEGKPARAPNRWVRLLFLAAWGFVLIFGVVSLIMFGYRIYWP